jgi:hypothetical protein
MSEFSCCSAHAGLMDSTVAHSALSILAVDVSITTVVGFAQTSELFDYLKRSFFC